MKKFIFLCVIILFLTNFVYAGGIWPFNTPSMEASLICKNVANHIEFVAERRSIYSLSEMLEVYQEPEWRSPENYLYRRECIRAVKMAYQNKNITPKTLKNMMQDDCNARKKTLIKEIKRRKID